MLIPTGWVIFLIPMLVYQLQKKKSYCLQLLKVQVTKYESSFHLYAVHLYITFMLVFLFSLSGHFCTDMHNPGTTEVRANTNFLNIFDHLLCYAAAEGVTLR